MYSHLTGSTDHRICGVWCGREEDHFSLHSRNSPILKHSPILQDQIIAGMAQSQ